jgi:hypothetical protein
MPGSSSTDAYLWIGGVSGGSWDLATNWDDVTATGVVQATAAPGAGDPVSLNVATSSNALVIVGGGLSASLDLTGSIELENGSYTTLGALTIGDIAGLSSAGYNTLGDLTLGSGAQLTAASANLIDGSLTATGGGGVSIIGALTTDAGSYLYAEGAGSTLTAGATVFGVEPDVYSGDYVDAGNGGAIQLASLTLEQLSGGAATNNGNGAGLWVDSLSSIEIGTSGGAAAGAVTVDSGATLTEDVTAYIDAGVVNNGLIDDAGDLQIDGALSGNGRIQIDANATLQLGGDAAASQTLTINGSGATIEISGGQIYNSATNTWTTALATVASTIANFAVGDAILLDGVTVTAANYTYNNNGYGTLVLVDGATQLETLTLQGNYTGQTFFVLAPPGNGSYVTLLAGPGGAPSPVSGNSDAFTWIGQSGGSWDVGANWKEGATNPATNSPGAGNAVTVNGSTGSAFEVIKGGDPGGEFSASLSITGDIDLQGIYTTGALEVGAISGAPSSSATLTTGGVALTSGSQLTATSANFIEGGAIVSGSGASFIASGAVSVGTPSGETIAVAGTVYASIDNPNGASLQIAGGATFSAGSLTIANGSLSADGTGTEVTIHGSVSLGETQTAADVSTLSYNPYTDTGDINVTNGAAVSIDGALTENNTGTLSAQGAGSTIAVGGTLVLDGEPNNFGGGLSAQGGGAILVRGGLTIEQVSNLPSGASASPVWINVDSASGVEIGSGGVTAGALTIGAGLNLTASVAAEFDAFVVNNGVIDDGADLKITGALSGSGQTRIEANATLTLQGNAAASQTLAFEGPGATLEATNGAGQTVAATLAGLVNGDSLLFDNATITSTAYTYNGGNSGTLALLNGKTTLETLTLQGDYSDQEFSVSHISATNSSKISLVACYRRGTKILTARGDVAVEDLAVGENVVTASGAKRPIRWIGHRTLGISRHPAPRDVWPVRIAADAFGAGLPRRDLWVSPGHNIVAEGVLIPACALLNGVSVAQVEMGHVEYWHVELDAHDILLAEGLPAESYLDCGNRGDFANGGVCVTAFPDFKPAHWSQTCLPLAKEGPEVERTKAHLLSRLRDQGWELTSDAQAHVLADGQIFAPVLLSDHRLSFVLPEGRKSIVLGSNVSLPAHVLPESSDLRALGLCVTRLQIDGEPLALDDDLLADGWHEAEFADGSVTHRWTAGAAKLPSGARFIFVDLGATGLYWRERLDAAAALFG